MGWENVNQCEIDQFCQDRLKHHFPSSHLYGDIRTITDWTGIDVLTGGFPCQPFSNAGLRRGTTDDRFLWPEMLRVIREVKPTWVVAENVCGILTQDDGMVFERVCTEMEEAGYDVQPFIIPACAVGAPHERKRVWFIANSHRPRLEGREEAGNAGPRRQDNNEHAGRLAPWSESPVEAATRILRVDDGVSRGLDGPRKNSLKAYGNAIVPQVAYMIFQAIAEAESRLSA